MQKLLFFLLLSLSGFAQSGVVLKKRLDSLKQLRQNQEQSLKALQSQISATEQRLGLVRALEPPVRFGKITITNRDEIVFWNDRFNKPMEMMYKIPPNSEISVVGYKKDFNDGNDYVQAIHKGKTGYIDAYFLRTNEELAKRIEAIKAQNAQIANGRKEEKNTKQNAKQKVNDPPLAINSVDLKYNSVSTPEASVVVSNLSTETIDRYEVTIACYDGYNRPVNHPVRKNNRFRGVYQVKLAPGQANVLGNWILEGHDNATRIVVSLVSVRFADGKTWKPTKAITVKSY
ncbi:DUF5780 domain-containing protein [Emticicia fluvialis]|uniref:DUF5780 domain-containing protein n=1 Tax=Emticicia fluvialis TaxID=2974474 RepID=UPI002165AA24|nr:DUF5780 domain-containing protein [Emticicia fluvialis]